MFNKQEKQLARALLMDNRQKHEVSTTYTVGLLMRQFAGRNRVWQVRAISSDSPSGLGET